MAAQACSGGVYVPRSDGGAGLGCWLGLRRWIVCAWLAGRLSGRGLLGHRWRAGNVAPRSWRGTLLVAIGCGWERGRATGCVAELLWAAQIGVFGVASSVAFGCAG